MNKSICLILSITLLISSVFAEEEKHNQKISVYFHPLALMLSTTSSAAWIYSTIEIPFNLYNALIVRPNIWVFAKGNENSSFDDKNFVLFDDYTNFVRLGSDIGLRFYLGGKNEGPYLQGQIGIFYFRNEENKINDLWLDAMGYFGWAWKYDFIATFFDAGIGYACINKEKFCSYMPDFNLGVGISF